MIYLVGFSQRLQYKNKNVFIYDITIETSQIISVSLILPMHVLCIQTLLLNLLKKPHQNALRSFKDLSIHRDRLRQGRDLVVYFTAFTK